MLLPSADLCERREALRTNSTLHIHYLEHLRSNTPEHGLCCGRLLIPVSIKDGLYKIGLVVLMV